VATDRGRVRNLVIYTALRLLLWLGVWAILQFLTPLKGLLAVVISLLVSSAISIVVLDRQRDAMSEGVNAFFARINERIEKSAAAEDFWAEPSGPGEQPSGEQSVDEHDEAGLLEHKDKHRPDSTA